MVNLPDLPVEIILQILSYFGPPIVDLFWQRGITPQTLIPFSLSLDNKSRSAQIENAKCLGLMVWRAISSTFGTNIRYMRLTVSSRELAIQLPYIPLEELESQFKIIWPHLTSLQTLTLTLTPAYGCPSWLATQLKSIPSLQTLRLRVMGDSIGSYLRELPNVRNLYIEIYPPDVEDRETDPLGPGPPMGMGARQEVSREAYHSWSTLFNDLTALIESCENVARMGWHVHWTMAHAFYRHTSSQGGLPDSGPLIKCISVFPPLLTSLSLSLESQLGTEPFVRALGGLPITDLALVSYDHLLLLGTEFENFCKAFGKLRRLKLKLRAPSITIGGSSLSRFPVDMEPIVRGLSSLPHLRSYRGPILIKRPSSIPSVASTKLIRIEAKTALIELADQLTVK
ncbi:hypothetical protein FRC11_002109, partial [Ceratobasidium sp. 423]